MTEKRKPGRPKGKRSDPDYILCCGLVKKKTLKQVKHLLLDRDLELSQLMEQLFQEWIDQNSQ
ncbi:MAG TPA: hypothetical protein V6D10_07340 [Trichocoleus sp.]|jgi:hypothetical protein